MQISHVFDGLTSQQLSALINILNAAKKFAEESNTDHKQLLAARLYEDMHPLSWQLQTTVELIVRAADRLTMQEPTSLVLEEDNFDELIARVEQIKDTLLELDKAALDQSVDTVIEIPVGPEASLSLTGQDYVLKFLLPNVYFHLTTAYDLLRMQGVPLGKRDYMGPI